GVPAAGPLWIDYAGHNAPIVPKKGLILALSSGVDVPAELRASGAATIFFDLHLNDRVGTPSKPVDPAAIPAKARAEFAFAQQVTGCATPLIAENELFGAQTPAPWTPTTAQYRANVLLLLQELDELGATTALTIANPPYTGDEAADWWRRAAQASILVRQVYYGHPTRALYEMGPVAASRYMRQWMRALIGHFGQIGIPASRVALELQFQSAPGEGGREGLQPKAAWLEFVKLEALAAKQVASELKVEGIWSWGWPSFSVAGNDPDKAAAACVYLWSRDPRLCDGPVLAGPGFDASLTEGQLRIPAGLRCTLGAAGRITKSDVARTAEITGDRESAASALLQRVALRAASPIDPVTVLSAERAIVRDRFGGSVARYHAALAAAHVPLADARAIIADRIARERVEERFRPRPATAAQLAAFAETYATTRVRLVSVDVEAPWLGDAVRGWAVATIAPGQVFSLPTGARKPIDTIDGRFRVRALGPALPLLALPPARARDVARGVLGRFARDDVYERWLSTQQSSLLANAVCARDRLPVNADVDLTAFVPFLGA
ncbi:MAG TPA: hypothetical protein VNR59_12665, partial [Gaiellaceae bacterium]|nr:hypothetical protein [Gaiellaceae bacterium]